MKVFKKIMFYITLPVTFVLGLLIVALMYILIPFDYFSDFAILGALKGWER